MLCDKADRVGDNIEKDIWLGENGCGDGGEFLKNRWEGGFFLNFPKNRVIFKSENNYP